MPPKCSFPNCETSQQSGSRYCEYHSRPIGAADPAQSAPSAELFVKNFPNKFASVAAICEAYAALRTAQLREAVDWVLHDAAYKAPEQIGDAGRRWISRLQDAVK